MLRIQFVWNVKACFMGKIKKNQFVICWLCPESGKVKLKHKILYLEMLILVLLNPIYVAIVNSVDPDLLASEENWSGSALFVI